MLRRAEEVRAHQAAAILAQVQEGFDSIANTLNRFEAELTARLSAVQEEFHSYALTVNAKIRHLERRLEVMESILFEPDPESRAAKIAAVVKPSLTQSSDVLQWPNDKPAA